jgi:hypothetical protein
MRPRDNRVVLLDVSTVRTPSTFRQFDLWDDVATIIIPGTWHILGKVDITLNRLRQNWDHLSSWDRLTVIGVGLDRNQALSLGAPKIAHLSRRTCVDPIGFGDLLPWDPWWVHNDICSGPFEACDIENRCADSCGGDSGGPLYRVSTNGSVVVYGVVSRGVEQCGSTGRFGGRPGIYAATDLHLPFIETVAETYGVPLQQANKNCASLTTGVRIALVAGHMALLFIIL